MASVEWRPAGGTQAQLSVQYRDHHRVGNGDTWLPQQVRLQDHGRETELTVRFKSQTVNIEVPPGAFTQTPRAGLVLDEVACD